MKKIGLFIFILFLITGCGKEKLDDIEIPEINDDKVTTYVDDNPIKVGLYKDEKLVSKYENIFRNDVDIANFDVYFTNEDNVYSSYTKSNWYKYYNLYENIDEYKVGFYITFKDEEKTYEKVVLDPDVEFALAPYIYIYIYDDIHVNGNEWYSHLTKDTYNDKSIFSSIKLYMAEKCEKIITPITLTVFTYKSINDFNDKGYYRGNSFYTVEIINK